MEVQLARRLINVEEYYQMYEAGILTDKDRVELIHGEILEMSPTGSKHAAVVDRLTNYITTLVEKQGIVRIQNPIVINDLNEPEPDLMLLKPKEDYYAEKHPGPKDVIVVVEVSDTTYGYDKNVKLPLYAAHGIPEFWIVNIEKREVEVFTVPGKSAYKKRELFYQEDTIPITFCNREIAVSDILGKSND